MIKGNANNNILSLTRNGNIVIAEFTEETSLDLELAKLCVQKRVNFTNSEYSGLVFDLRNIISIDLDARKFLGSDKASEKMNVGALVINNPIQKSIVNFYLKLNKPKVPSKMFTNRIDAIEWVKLQLNTIIKNEI